MRHCTKNVQAHDDEILGLIMSEDCLTPEEYALGDRLRLLENRDMWRAYRADFIWQPLRNVWIYVWQTEWCESGI